MMAQKEQLKGEEVTFLGAATETNKLEDDSLTTTKRAPILPVLLKYEPFETFGLSFPSNWNPFLSEWLGL